MGVWSCGHKVWTCNLDIAKLYIKPVANLTPIADTYISSIKLMGRVTSNIWQIWVNVDINFFVNEAYIFDNIKTNIVIPKF